jgi:Bacteriophage probable baseplate hub protein
MGDSGGNAVFAARPTIRVGGQDNAELSGGLLSLLIAETAAGLYRCEALFGNWRGASGFLYFDRRTLEFGKAFQVKIGNDILFDGRIMALEARFPEGGSPQINVLAEDRLQDLRMTRRTRSFLDMSDSSVFSQIAADHGLSPQLNLSGPTHKVLAQTNQSDLAFVRERARALDAEVWVDGTTLHAAPRRNRASGAPLAMALGARLREFSVIADLANQYTSISVGGWDVAGKSALSPNAAESAIASELDNGESGPSILSSAIGQRKQTLSHAVPHTSAEAQAQAEASFRSMARRFVVGRGLAQTDARLRVGICVDLTGLGPLFSGKYYVAALRHMFDSNQGIRTEFTGERPGLGRP